MISQKYASAWCNHHVDISFKSNMTSGYCVGTRWLKNNKTLVMSLTSQATLAITLIVPYLGNYSVHKCKKCHYLTESVGVVFVKSSSHKIKKTLKKIYQNIYWHSKPKYEHTRLLSESEAIDHSWLEHRPLGSVVHGNNFINNMEYIKSGIHIDMFIYLVLREMVFLSHMHFGYWGLSKYNNQTK